MRPRIQAMEQLFDTVADTIGDGVSSDRMAKYERQIHELVCHEKQATTARLRWAVVVAPVAAVAVLLGLFLNAAHQTIPFTLAERHAATAGVVGAWITTDVDETTRLDFDMGSTSFSILPKSSVQVNRSDKAAVKLALKNGSLRANIQGNGATRWSVDAGPYTVTVLGTKFETTWNAVDEVLDVTVDRGRVLVSGEGISGDGIQVIRKQHFRAVRKADFYAVKSNESDSYEPHALAMIASFVESGGATHWSPQSAAHPPASGQTEPADVRDKDGDALFEKPEENGSAILNASGPSPEKRKGRSPDEKVAFVRRGSKEKSIKRWLRHYNQGNYDLALEAALDTDLDKLLASLHIKALWKLIHAARTIGRDDIAKQALRTCRDRFPDSSKARRATFLLGKIAFDRDDDPAMASEWFERYLIESPNGPLAEEALGRLVIINNFQGRVGDAQRTARRYLDTYPTGSFAENAREILGEE